MILNVTPQEFSEIKEHELAYWDHPAQFAAYMHRFWGCEYYQSYKIVVRRDVDFIPMYHRGIYRIEGEGR